MNQSQLARIVKVHRSFISMVLNGKREPGKRLAFLLTREVPGTRIMDWLFAKANYKKLRDRVGRA